MFNIKTYISVFVYTAVHVHKNDIEQGRYKYSK